MGFQMKYVSLALYVLLMGHALALKCPQGEVPNSNSVCIEPTYIQGCHQYSTSSKCAKCEYKYSLQPNGLCEFNSENSGPCCLQINESGLCTQCNTGLFLQKGVCKQSDILGCLEKDAAGRCVNCASDFSLLDGKCKRGIKYCEKYFDSAQTMCTQCKVDHSLINNVCLKNQILGCQEQIDDHTCLKCFEPFKSKDKHCQVQNCASHNYFGCTACDCGYYLTQKYTCEQVQSGCIRYQRGVCTDCQPQFKLRGSICVIEGCIKKSELACEKCKDEYELEQGECLLKNCNYWDNEFCYSCKNGFAPLNGKCVQNQALPLKFLQNA